MRTRILALTAVAALFLALPLFAEAKIDITGAALVSAQDNDFDSTTGVLDEDFNFNDPRVNLYVHGDVSDKISFDGAFWVSNDWTSENQREGAATATGSGLVDGVVLLTGSLTIKDIAGSGFNLKAGTIDIPYGWEYVGRTNNGDDKKNDFITNSLLDINGSCEGISLAGSFDMGQTSTPLSWEIALVNGGIVNDGSPSGTTNQNKSNDDLAWALRAEVGAAENLTLQASYYTNDQKGDGDNDPMNIGSSFLVNSVASTATGIPVNPNLNGLVYVGTVGAQAAQNYNRDLWEVSAKYDYGQGYLMAFWGNIDADSGGTNTDREWDYLGVQGRYNFDENSYLAIRWNELDPDYNLSNNLGKPELWSVAGGYKLADNAMLKAEWTSLDEGGDGFGSPVANTKDNKSQDADALTVSVGVSF